LIDQETHKDLDVAAAAAEEVDRDEEVSKLSGYYVKLPAFEGPFDLLLHLIDEGKVDIYNVSITQIVVGYVEYLKAMKDLDIVVASEFLVMAAYLLEMKSRMLLPVEPKPEDQEGIEEIEQTLLERLHEYKVFKDLAERLRERKEIFGRVYLRKTAEDDTAEADRDVFLSDVTLRDLVVAFQKIWKEAGTKPPTIEIVDENITVSAKIKEILSKISGKPEGVPFEEMFTRLVRLEIVVTFLAILELARQRMIGIKQGDIFGSIRIFERVPDERGQQS
jgi:segregation and condensation protein A